MSEASPKVVLLLGAGASKEAGCPLVTELTESFAESLKSTPRLADAYEWIRGRLQARGGTVDIESVLAAIRSLQDRERDLLTAFVQPAGFAKEVRRFSNRLPDLERRLQEHIRATCEVSRQDVDYLRPLLDFLAAEEDGLDIFTLDYDCAIELLCQEANVPHTDGFGTYWEPERFERPVPQVRLHKLHGSLLWFETARAPRRLVKIPFRAGGAPLRFFSDDEVSSALIYPTIVKEQHAEPYATLLGRFRSALALADILIVIGYSFRDSYLKDLILEKMHENQALQLWIVSPNSYDSVVDSDRTVGGSWTFEHVRHRIRLVTAITSDALENGRLVRSVRRSSVVRRFAEEVDAARLGGGEAARGQSISLALQTSRDDVDADSTARLLSGDGDGAWCRGVRLMPREGWARVSFALIAHSLNRLDKKAMRGYVKEFFEPLLDGALGLLGWPAGTPSPQHLQGDRAELWFSDHAISAESLLKGGNEWHEAVRWHVTPSDWEALRAVVVALRAVTAYWHSGTRQRYTGHEMPRNPNQGAVFHPVPQDKGVRKALDVHFERGVPRGILD